MSSVRIEGILDNLADQLAECWHAYCVSRTLNAAYRDRKISSAVYFFAAAVRFSGYAAVLGLARVVENNKDSVNIWYLLNSVQSNPAALPKLTVARANALVTEHRTKLAAHEHLFQNLKTQRDKTLAHHDRILLTNPQAAFVPIPANDFEQAWRLLLDIVNTYNGYRGESLEFRVDTIEPFVNDDISYILSLISQADNRPPINR